MESKKLRYTGLATVKQSYTHEFAVRCPKCGGLARVMPDSQWLVESARLTCTQCGHVAHSRELVRYNLLVNRYCDHCGKKIAVTIPQKKQPEDRITISCPHCNTVRTYQPRNEKIRLVYNSSGLACDPVFNLPLWFQADIKGHLFWAYNRRHLSDIKDYVAAKLRERQTNAYTTMVERLPQFIKAAKNRQAILKVITQLQQGFTAP